MLKPCPNSPNCVSSQSQSTQHTIPAFTYQHSKAQAHNSLLQVLKAFPRTRIIKQTEDSIHAECRSLIFRFVDDVEFMFDVEKSLIHVRSASRVGYSDLGANRRRVEALRKQFEAVSAES